jgi:hypothetical protein
MDRLDELLRKRDRLYRRVRPHRRLKLKVHDARRSLTEALIARGDRRLGPVFLRLLGLGARFDAWDDRFDPTLWDRALEAEGLDPGDLLHRPLEADEVLPWGHLGASVSVEHLGAERDRALAGERTESCLTGRCSHCGADVSACRPARKLFRAPGNGEDPGE